MFLEFVPIFSCIFYLWKVEDAGSQQLLGKLMAKTTFASKALSEIHIFIRI